MVVAEVKSRIRVGDMCTMDVVAADASLRRYFGDDGPSVDRNGFAKSVAVVPSIEPDPTANVSEAILEGNGEVCFEIEILTGVVCSEKALLACLASAASSLL